MVAFLVVVMGPAGAHDATRRDCNVTFVRSDNKDHRICVFGRQFGCLDALTMWVEGCRGDFVCNGEDVHCGFHGMRGASHCPCVPGWVGETPQHVLPAHLAVHRLNDNTNLPSPRFVPTNDIERFAAIFTLWNLLDGVMYHVKQANRFSTGYVRELQLRRMVELARAPHVRKYCEVCARSHSSLVVSLTDVPLSSH